ITLGDPSAINSLVSIGAFSGLILALITSFKPDWSPYTSIPYSLAEGLALGAISALLNRVYPGIALNAVLITFSVMLIMLFLFRTGVIQATERFKSVVITATIGIVLASLFSFALSFMGMGMHLYSTGTYGLLFSVFVCIIAALNLIIDFDFVIKGAQSNAPKHMEWFAAFGLMVTLVWLYIEILRLLSLLARKD
ncbi:MAG: Bax inhibitor-1/YccA family protein, partial [Candidatus Riflebacteria bacterium]|nr:Bax inhibitor-1/YccA family protein [Candidatus Riflebacteria bacterium]